MDADVTLDGDAEMDDVSWRRVVVPSEDATWRVSTDDCRDGVCACCGGADGAGDGDGTVAAVMSDRGSSERV